MSVWKDNFCYNICYMLKERQISKKEMAQILGISVDTLHRIERGIPTVRVHTGMLYRFCDYFQISADTVLRTRLGKSDTAPLL